MPLTNPENTRYCLRSGARHPTDESRDPQVRADLAYGLEHEAPTGGQGLERRHAEHAARRISEQARRHINNELVDEPRLQQRAVQSRAGLDPDVVDLVHLREVFDDGAQIAVLRVAGDALDARP